MKIIHETEVLVIGAGVVGCTIAYHLAQRGKSVTVVDSGSIGAGSSSANMALVWVQSKEPTPYMELNLLSSRLHTELAAEFDEDVELRQPGGIILCYDEKELESRLAVMEHFKASCSEYQAHALSAVEVRELEPFVTPDLAGESIVHMMVISTPLSLYLLLCGFRKSMEQNSCFIHLCFKFYEMRMV